MKKIVSLLMCCVFAISAFTVFPHADEAITHEEAVALMEKLISLNEVKAGTEPDEMCSDEYVDKETDTALKEVFHTPNMAIAYFYPTDPFKTVDGWNAYMKTFLTEEFVDNIIFFGKGAVIQHEGNVYFVDGAASAPYYPAYNKKQISENVRIVDNDTFAFTATYEYQQTGEKEIDVVYTEDGWRITDCETARLFIKPYSKNPDTSDNIIVIVVCATAALVGIALTANKRRFAR